MSDSRKFTTNPIVVTYKSSRRIHSEGKWEVTIGRICVRIETGRISAIISQPIHMKNRGIRCEPVDKF